MNALDLIAADPSLLLRAALDQIRVLQIENDALRRQLAELHAARRAAASELFNWSPADEP